MASKSTGTVKRKPAAKKAPAKPRAKKAAAKDDTPTAPPIELAPDPVEPAPLDDAPNPGVESGNDWLPPAEPGKLAELTVLKPTGKPDASSEWTVEEIRDGLQAITFGVDVAAGRTVGAQLTMSEAEATAVARPLTRIINRRAKLRAMKREGGDVVDVIQIALATLPYGIRVVGEGMETRRQAVEDAKRAAAAEQESWASEAPDA